MFSTFEKIKELAKKQGKSLGAVEEDFGHLIFRRTMTALIR